MKPFWLKMFAVVGVFPLSACTFFSSSAALSTPNTSFSSTPEPPDFSSYRLYEHPSLSALRNNPLNSLGHRKILVIPIFFTNSAEFSHDDLTLLDKAYNGQPSDTGWQSLRSFYETSSYGKLILETTIATPYQYPGTDQDFQDRINNTNSPYTVGDLANAILAQMSGINLDDYDENDDFYVDGIEMIYKNSGNLSYNPYDDTTKVWWNFTEFSSAGGTKANPHCGIYFWAQFSTLMNGYYEPNIDCHTFIHETGHILGLDDYYSYDKSEAPAGECDMMDFNIGDHDAYSKMLLGWVEPKTLKEDTSSLTLRSFTETGDCLLLRSNSDDPWNGMPYDEYLLLQYYTPTGLNKADSAGYHEWAGAGEGSLYKKAGLQVFHIDARTYSLAATSHYSQIQYSDVLNGRSHIAASNTDSRSIDIAATQQQDKGLVPGSPYRLIKAISATGTDDYCTDDFSLSFGGHYYDKFLGRQSTLFGLPDYGCGSAVFSPETMQNLFANKTAWNDGHSMNESFEVVEQNDSSITLSFSKQPSQQNPSVSSL